MRRCDTIRGRKVEDRRKVEEMTTPITLPPIDELTLTELHRRYKETTDAETRTRYQMLLFSLRGQTSSQIAHHVLRSQDTDCGARRRARSPTMCCAVRTPWCVCSNAS